MSSCIICDCYLICLDIVMCHILVKLPNTGCVEVCTTVLKSCYHVESCGKANRHIFVLCFFVSTPQMA